MELNNKNTLPKKIISISLVASLFITSTNAENFFDDITLSNSTSAGTWSDPRSGSKYFSGGNFTFKFKNVKSYPLIMNGSSPEVKMGCNGISISGGFLSILGLKDIQEQLSNASVAFAWGILLGLEYTLPSVSAVFEKIRKWARALQNLLQNACAIGKNLSKGFIASQNVETNIFSGMQNNIDEMNNALGSVDDFFNKIDDFVGCNTGIGCQKVKEPIQSKLKEKLRVGASSVSATSTTFSSQITPPATAPLKSLKVDTLSNLYLGKISDITLTVNDNFKNKVIFDKLKWVFFGDFAVSNKSYKEIAQFFDESSGEINKDEVSKYFKNITINGDNKDSIKLVLIQPTITDINDVVSGLMDGFSEISDKCSSGICEIKNHKVVYIDLPSKVDESGDVKDRYNTMFVVPSLSADNKDNLKLEWSGFYNESLKAIKILVKNKSNVDTVYDTNLNTSDGLATIKAPLLLPNINKYIQTIASLERQNGQETPYTASLKYQLAKANAYMATQSFVNMM